MTLLSKPRRPWKQMPPNRQHRDKKREDKQEHKENEG